MEGNVTALCMCIFTLCPREIYRGFCVQASMELVPEDVSLLERCSRSQAWREVTVTAAAMK